MNFKKNIIITGGAGFNPWNNDKMEGFYYIYILESEKDGKKYTGYTSNLSLRFEAHQTGQVPSTKDRRPLKLIYFEGCLSQADAVKREKYLKTHYGKMFLGNRLKAYFTDQENNDINLKK